VSAARRRSAPARTILAWTPEVRAVAPQLLTLEEQPAPTRTATPQSRGAALPPSVRQWISALARMTSRVGAVRESPEGLTQKEGASAGPCALAKRAAEFASWQEPLG